MTAPLAVPGTPVPPLTPPRAKADGWRERWRVRWCDWRNRQVADPAFQRRAAAAWFTRPVVRRQAGELFDLMAGFVYTQVLLSCVRLQVFDLLAHGPLPLARIAAATGLDIAMAQRLCAAAAALELLDLRSDGTDGTDSADGAYALGRLGAPLVGNAALHAMIEHHATLYADLADPLALLRGTSQPAMAGYWPYAAVDAPPAARQALTPDRVAEYSRLMSASLPLVAQEVLGAYRFQPHRCLLDVGGGEGRFITAVAAQAPALQFMLFDLPAVASRAQGALAAAGLGARVQVHGGDFFQDELPRGADIVSLIRVAFDHPDERVLRLLRAARRALPDDGSLLLAEPMAGVAGAEAMGDAYFGFYLLAMGHGRPRTAAELTALLEAAGFGAVQQLRLNLPLQTGLLVARCRPA